MQENSEVKAYLLMRNTFTIPGGMRPSVCITSKSEGIVGGPTIVR
jgi:hypothetical protein